MKTTNTKELGYTKPLAQRTTSPRPSCLRRDLLPHGVEQVLNYYQAQGLTLSQYGDWRNAICPFHKDTKPSLRIRIETGSYRCMVCGAKGGSALDFHMMKHRMGFKEAARDLGAWVEGVGK